VIPWREQVVDFSEPTFPTQIWLISRKDSSLRPVAVDRVGDRQIRDVKLQISNGYSIIGKKGTCLDPELYGITENVIMFNGPVSGIANAVARGEGDAAILDVPDTLIELRNPSSVIRVIGPVSEKQVMAVAFAKSSDGLRRKFNEYLGEIKKSGSYRTIVKKYYPSIMFYFPEYFKK